MVHTIQHVKTMSRCICIHFLWGWKAPDSRENLKDWWVYHDIIGYGLFIGLMSVSMRGGQKISTNTTTVYRIELIKSKILKKSKYVQEWPPSHLQLWFSLCLELLLCTCAWLFMGIDTAESSGTLPYLKVLEGTCLTKKEDADYIAGLHYWRV